METRNTNHREKHKEIYTITWEGIPITITYIENYFAKAGVSHLSFKADEPLPLTETGYRSVWLFEGQLGGKSPVEYVIDALNVESQAKKWIIYLKEKQLDDMEKRQLKLF